MSERHESALLHFMVRAVMTPAIMLYGLYVLVHGELSPGGGFQAGAILAAGLILSWLTLGRKSESSIFSRRTLIVVTVLGMVLYTGTGILAMLFGGDYLDYGAIPLEWLDYALPGELTRRQMGVFGIEIGVALAVFGTLSLAADYLTAPRSGDEEGEEQ
ncbi:MAG: sodium:proton antiporter [Dehalococcoidia bacterium]|nr:sodium:proton antiporter [Dehalococcoidia bacterium]